MRHIAEISIYNAQNNISKLSPEVLAIDGMSSNKIRHLLNNICHYANKANYLEIGSWKGSTLISASYLNQGNFIGIDNFQYFGSPKEEFYANKKLFEKECSIQFYENNCWEIDQSLLPQIDIYFYDGKHDAESQYNAFVKFNNILNKEFVAIVDDWNVPAVQEGTNRAFKDLGYKVIYEWGSLTQFNGDRENFWNGIYVGVIQK